MGYICGFDGRYKDVRLQMERQWKMKRNISLQNGNNDMRSLVRLGQAVIEDFRRRTTHQTDELDLRLVCLFRDD